MQLNKYLINSNYIPGNNRVNTKTYEELNDYVLKSDNKNTIQENVIFLHRFALLIRTL